MLKIDTLTQLASLMQGSLNRCERCGKEGNVYDCEECQETKEQFASTITDLVNALEPNGEKRMLILLEALAPILES